MSEYNAVVHFSFIDYGVFIGVLVISAAIGFYYAWNERKNQTLDQVLLGGRKLKIFPVAMSIMASFTSAVSILGFSLEMYRFGSMYILIGFSYFITQPFAAQVYVPFFHRLKITSAYEYLEKRFNNLVRITAAAIFCLEMFLYMAVVLYSPAIAIQQVTGISLWVSIFITGFVCTVYTSLGGMKAVVFTDTFQVLIMFAGTFAIIIEGARRLGGFGPIFERMKIGDRLELFDFDPSPFKRHTFWSLMIGGFFTSLTVYGSNQATIQRYLTLPTVYHAKFAMYVNLLGTWLILIACCLCGFVAYGYYFGCDPFLDGKISNYNQILPFLVMDLLEGFYGLPGLFIACVYSAALSTVSSGLNSLTAVFLHDFIYPLNKFFKKKDITEKTSMLYSKLLAALFGIITIGLSFLCQYAGSTVLQLSLSIFGILGGPLLGVISLGMFVPFANSYGAMAGLIVSIVVNFWLGLGSILYGQKPKSKPFTQHLCSIPNIDLTNQTYIYQNLTSITSTSMNITSASYLNSKAIFDISYYWFSLIAIIITFVLGCLVSLLTRKAGYKVLEPNLLFDYGLCSFSKQAKKMNDEKHKMNLLDKKT